MKTIAIVFILFIFCISCEKTEDNTNMICSSNCTTLSGKFVTLNDQPVPDVAVKMNYVISGGELGGGSIRKIVNVKSDQNGNFSKDFYIKDSELGHGDGSFYVGINDNNLDVNKYIRTHNNSPNGAYMDINFYISSITNRDTIIDKTFYIPKKAFIKVNLNNFVPIQPADRFEIQTLFPFGEKIGLNTLLGSEYDTGFSGYGIWVAKNLNNNFNVFVAEGVKNIVRVNKVKNGVHSSQDYEIVVPSNNTIELTYTF